MFSKAFRHSLIMCVGLGMIVSSGVTAQTRDRRDHDHDRDRRGRKDEKRIERSIGGPVLDYVFERQVGLRPLLGIPGAAVWGDVIALPDIAEAAVSVERNYALAISEQDRLPMLIGNLSHPIIITTLADTPGVDRIALSPTGAVAALYRADSASMEVVSGLPGTPASLWNAAVPGALEAVAVADNGKAVIVVVASGESRFAAVLEPGSGWRYLAAVDGPASVTFLRNREDAVFTDSAASQILLVRDVTGTAQILALAGEREGISRPVAVAASADNRSVVVANSAPGGMVVVSLGGGDVRAIASRCASTGLVRLAGNSVFRLTEPGSPQLCLFDADSSIPRVVFVPPPARADEQGGAE